MQLPAHLPSLSNTHVNINTLYQILLAVLVAGLWSCQSNPQQDQQTVANDTLASVSSPPAQQALANYETAKAEHLENPSDADALIWYGRRTAYLGRYEDAIEIYTQGILQHPQDARMYRHRGHRYISTRKYKLAIADLEKAASLIEGQEDQVEPDGLPNARNIPLSTLHGNIWYHLGLAYYLQHDLPNALRAYSNRTVTEKYPDNLVSGGHWLYMILRQLGRPEEAAAAIDSVKPGMDIIENTSYYKMCLFYKGLLPEEALRPDEAQAAANDVYHYGLGNWYLYDQQDTLKAKALYQALLAHGNRHSFAYLAAESDWHRLFGPYRVEDFISQTVWTNPR